MRFCLFVLFVTIGSVQYASTAFATPGNTTAPSPDSGEIWNSDANTGKIRCWVVRKLDAADPNNIEKSSAYAISIYKDPITSKPLAKIRRYAFDKDESTYLAQAIAFKGNTSKILSVRLDLVPASATVPKDVYKLVYTTNANTEEVAGTVRFIRGAAGRTSSDLVARLSADLGGAPTPCDNPTDDIGEEEEMDVGVANAPYLTLANAPNIQGPVIATPTGPIQP